MLLPHSDIDVLRLCRVIQQQYSGAADGLEFVPLGEDSWCYRSGSLWVSVRRDLLGHRPSAYELAHRLHRGGLHFVLAPLAGAEGRVVHTFEGHPVVVFPHLQVSQLGARQVTGQHIDRLVGLLDIVHRADIAADIDSEDFRLPFADELERGLRRASDGDLALGPYSGPLQDRLPAASRFIAELRAEAEDLARYCRSSDNDFVLTHGEPSTANALLHDGDMMLADWGGAMQGPAERDWFHVARSTGQAVPGRSEFLRFYELKWTLSEISEYVGRFTRPHGEDADDRAMWNRLISYLPPPSHFSKEPGPDRFPSLASDDEEGEL